jgi:hypothetical protein
MLGSRGFVYHSEETAGSDNDWHPHCNCQIAVTFQPDLLFYEKNGVRVSRGYQGSETYVVKTGRDGSDVMRQVDIDELYDEYLKMGQKFTSTSSYRSYPSHTSLTKKEYDAAIKELEDAETLEELHEVGAQIVDRWKIKSKGGAFDDEQWNSMSRRARELERQMKEREAQPKREVLTARQKLERQARAVVKNQAAELGITEQEALRRFDLLVGSNTDAQLRRFIKRYSDKQA